MISLEDIRNLAHLARLKLTPAEEESLQKDISGILDYVGQVSAVSEQGPNQGPTLNQGSSRSDLITPRNVMREDVPTLPLGAREALVAAFPKREGDFNVVRKIIEKDE